MYLADTTVLSKGHHPDFYDYMERMSVLAKRLYNAALFRLRQAYTGWEREARTANEKAVFEEIRLMQAKYPRVKVRRVLSYRALDAVMRANGNPDFFAGLPMQTAQRVLKEAADVFGAWQSALKEYGEAAHAEVPEGGQAYLLYHEPGRRAVPGARGRQQCGRGGAEAPPHKGKAVPPAPPGGERP